MTEYLINVSFQIHYLLSKNYTLKFLSNYHVCLLAVYNSVEKFDLQYMLVIKAVKKQPNLRY